MSLTRRQLLRAVAAWSLLPLAACKPSIVGLPKDKIMQKYPLKTYAVGRYLIDFPEVAKDVSMSQRFSGMDMEWKSATADQYRALLSLRVNTLKGLDPSTQLLIKDEAGTIPQSRILLFEENTNRDGLIQFEAYRYSEEVHGYFFLSGSAARKKVALVEPSVNEVLGIIQPRIIDPKMTENGACFDRAFVSGTHPSVGEEVAIMAKFHDITISFSTQVIDSVDSGPSLLQRATKADEYSGIKILRKSKREVAGLSGAEFAFKAPPGSEVNSHTFQWEYQGTPNSVAAPEMRVGLNIPNGTDAAKLSDEELLGLWDAVLGSVRLRPGAV
jgi:Tle cognate immunity protein 4 C-terminal domain/Tle cognate immunity protein 4 N-terminal domain